ncbi:MAG: alpha/beta hydrolase [Actinomycetota bacterium]|nr:alpha/beta hydrolase [Actinomycetota bacterium]
MSSKLMDSTVTGNKGRGSAVPPTRSEWIRSAVSLVWCRRRNGWVSAVVVVGLYALVAGWLTPRGPVTTGQALAAIGVSLLVGAAAGLATRSRWAMLVAPATFVAVFELARMTTTGPLVDGIHLGSVYGIIAFASGRVLHGVLALLPMLLGAAVGAGSARHLSGVRHRRGWLRSTLRWGRRSTTALLAVGLVVLTAGLARPATTAPILGPDGRPLAGSVAELRRLEVNGLPLSMMIRGDSVTNPVLLYLAGGPGGSDLGGLRRNSQNLEQAFTLVSYDQRGAGKSDESLDPISTLTVAGAVSDAVAVTDYLRERFHQDKIYLVGNSWGSMLGVLAAQQHPEKYAAFVGSGQMVDPAATDRVYYQDTLAWATRTTNTALVEQLTRNGPPPYADALNYEPVLTNEQKVYPYDDTTLAEGQAGFSENLFHPEYSLIEQLHLVSGVLNAFSFLYPQLQDIDFRTQVTALQIPVYLVQGGHETPGRAEPATEWFQQLQAPRKQLITFENSGHRALFQEPDRFYQVMTATVLAQTRR